MPHRIAVQRGRRLEATRHDDADCPLRQRAQQLRVSVQKKPEVGGHLARHQIHKYMTRAVLRDADRQLVGKVSDRLVITLAERQMRVFVLLQAVPYRTKNKVTE